MIQYRAIVSIYFDEEDLADLAENFGVDPERLDAGDCINGALDNLDFGRGWLEQIYVNGSPRIGYLTEGITVMISPHEDA